MHELHCHFRCTPPKSMILSPGVNFHKLPPTIGKCNQCFCNRAAAFSISNHSLGTNNKSSPNRRANAGKSSRACGLQASRRGRDGTDGLRRPRLPPVAGQQMASRFWPSMAGNLPPMSGKMLAVSCTEYRGKAGPRPLLVLCTFMLPTQFSMRRRTCLLRTAHRASQRASGC